MLELCLVLLITIHHPHKKIWLNKATERLSRDLFTWMWNLPFITIQNKKMNIWEMKIAGGDYLVFSGTLRVINLSLKIPASSCPKQAFFWKNLSSKLKKDIKIFAYLPPWDNTNFILRRILEVKLHQNSHFQFENF